MNTMVLPFVLRDFLEHRLQPLFELATVLGAGEQQRHVEHQQTLAFQGVGNFLVDDALRQAFHDRGLAHARLADQHRIVLGPALQDLDRATDLVVAADDRIELALPRTLGQVQRVFGKCFALAFGLGVVDRLAAAHGRRSRARVPCGSPPCCFNRRPVSPLSSVRASRNSSEGMN